MIGGGHNGNGSAAQPDYELSPAEHRRLEALDSSQFGYINLKIEDMKFDAGSSGADDDSAVHDLLVIQKGIHLLEEKLRAAARPVPVIKTEPGKHKDSTTQQQDSVPMDTGDGEDEASRTESLGNVYLKLGHLHLLAEDFAKALSAYQYFYRLCKTTRWKFPAFHYGIGLVYFHFRAYAFATRAFRKVLHFSPDFQQNSQVHLRLGLSCKAQHNWEHALKHLNCALQHRQPCALGKFEIRYHIAHTCELSGDAVKARQLYEELIADAHDDAHQLSPATKACVYRQLGWLYFVVGERLQPGVSVEDRLNQAIATLQQSVHCDPTAGKTYYYLGRCYSALSNQAHQAFVNYRQSIDKSEADADTWCSIGLGA